MMTPIGSAPGSMTALWVSDVGNPRLATGPFRAMLSR